MNFFWVWFFIFYRIGKFCYFRRSFDFWIVSFRLRSLDVFEFRFFFVVDEKYIDIRVLFSDFGFILGRRF